MATSNDQLKVALITDANKKQQRQEENQEEFKIFREICALLAGEIAPPPVEFLAVAAQRVLLGEQADDAAVFQTVDHRQRVAFRPLEGADRVFDAHLRQKRLVGVMEDVGERACAVHGVGLGDRDDAGIAARLIDDDHALL